MFSEETTSTDEGGVSFSKSFNVSAGKTGTEGFYKDVSVFQAKFVPVPSLRLQMLGLGAQQKDQKKSHQRRRCEKTKSF